MPLLAQTQFSLSGTLFVVALMFAPLLVSWLVSVYENRLSVYFSEQATEPVNLKKVHVILSVVISYAVPLFVISFGLLALWQATASIWGVTSATSDTAPEHSPQKVLTFYAFSLVISLAVVIGFKQLLFRKHLRAPEAAEARALFMRWQRRVNLAAAFLNVTIYWAALWLFPELSMLTLN